MLNVNKARDKSVVMNWQSDPTYAPYCMRCRGLHRMTAVEPLLWKHGCGAVHDERHCLESDAKGQA